MSKVSATLGRNFIKSKEFQEAQLMGLDLGVCSHARLCLCYSVLQCATV